ncbi:MAG: hypothetical protein ACI9TY_001742 [Alphaproteobacteria bacterium]|jgi:hypothetical protein
MFSDKLFDHKYDIDQLLAAFCGDAQSDLWCLNTRNGEITAITDANDIVDGSDKNHLHIIESLPLSFLNELIYNAKFKKLSPDTQDAVKSIIKSVSSVQGLIEYFDDDDAGSYLVKTVKGACLDWLDMRNLIPPSMRHTGDLSMFGSLGNEGEKTKVKISIT